MALSGMGVYEVLLTLTGACYLGGVLWLIYGLRQPRRPSGDWLPSVSVVVAARNEEETIAACLGALRAQDYQGPFEAVVVDDRSTDRTALRVGAETWPQLRLVTAPHDLQFRCPKKSALAAGIEQSRGDLLLLTDADCQPPPDWVSRTVSLFGPGVGMALGHAFPTPAPSLRQRILALDTLAVGALGAGSAGMGRPLSCTGRNLAYLRRVYDEAGGFGQIGHLVGGDDVYFMRLVSRTSWTIVVNPAPVACGPAPAAWGAALQQKLRHAAKAGHYRGPALVLGAVVYLFHLLLGLGVAKLFLGEPSLVFACVWGAKWLVDVLLVAGYAVRPAERELLRYLPILELVYIPYILFFTLAGRFGWFRWK